MKKLNTFPGGHPPTVDDLDHLNEAIIEMNKAVAGLFSPALGMGIVWGITFSSSGGTVSWSQGAIAFFGEIYSVDAGSLAGTMQTLRLVPSNSYRTGNPILYLDGNARNVHEIRKATFATSGNFYGFTLTAENLDSLRVGNVWNYGIVQTSPWKVIEDIDMLNGWQNYYTSPQSAKCAYRRILDKIEFKGQLNNSGTINQPFFQLPVGYRPAVGRHCACVNHGLGFVAILELSVATDGTCVIRKDSTLSSHAITSLDGVSFPLS